MGKYRVIQSFNTTRWVYVEADSAEEARKLIKKGDTLKEEEVESEYDHTDWDSLELIEEEE